MIFVHVQVLCVVSAVITAKEVLYYFYLKSRA